MALTTTDLNNPLRLWSALVVAGTAPDTKTEILLYKIQNYASASSNIISASRMLTSDLRCEYTPLVTDPTSYNVSSLTIIDKYSNNAIASWNSTDYADAVAIFKNHTGTNGANWATWIAFTQAIIDSINKF
jgi:hypothetical protein